MEPTSAFIHAPDPEHPGWHTWDMTDQERFNPVVMGKMLVRQEADRAARLRLLSTRTMHGNLHGNIHGAVILGLIDISLFATVNQVIGGNSASSVTLDLSTQFIGSGRIGEPLDAVCEIMKETGRLFFLRGNLEQGGELIASYMGTLRKPSAR
ncbi:PaaI family thioesterase [Novosphingobium mathurense]|uniref:Acyl-coenzyme A thioesterase PaaI, contains HGG motif n=1 Tax=Novosphingobium mathurense TaxID=428990 RepID=A0A1U6GVN0_9SPHN|nr:PaaI family thioesterase [Novosphingobium mathurense]SLJ87577.1 Acyl-coenzyme A thioesterase PaaI, contains HGG motif [Novosphingobium mathurense]